MSGVASLPIAAWPIGRKVAAGAFAVAGYAALACAAVYLSGVLFLVLNKANPRQASFTTGICTPTMPHCARSSSPRWWRPASVF
jgi:hypothetical protein